MTEQEWLAGTDPTPMLEFVRHTASDRKLRLFAVACCRQASHLLADERSRHAVETAELFADQLARKKELFGAKGIGEQAAKEIEALWTPARSAAWAAVWVASGRGGVLRAAKAAISALVREAMDRGRQANAAAGVDAAGRAAHEARCLTQRAEDRQAAVTLRDIFRNPFRPSPTPLPAFVLAWNDGTVRRLAEATYEERRLPEGTLHAARLAVLADALLDAGCDDEELIQHCRSEEPHYRGCWALDCLLGKE